MKFRDYEDSSDNVELLYKNMYINQTYKLKKNIVNKLKFNKQYKIKDVFPLLNKVKDSSDPDISLPQIIHGYQTAEAIKQELFDNDKLKTINIIDLFSKEEWFLLDDKYKNLYNTTLVKFYDYIKDWNWLILIGLIHDLGKILVLDEFGKFDEWFSVGDIYPLGCKFDSSNIFYDKNYHKLCSDYSESEFNVNNIDYYGVYKKKCGFCNIEMTFSHDYYLSESLSKSNTNLPIEAIYIIRYHSFYSWHTPRNNIRGYIALADETDWNYLPLLKLFQKFDLYSKNDDESDNFNYVYYDKLIQKYIPNSILL